jgi:heparin binding hemagglutinin HbhA
MAITDNVRKALTDSTPFYAAAGTVDLAAEKLREVQPLLERLRDEAPSRIEKVRATDPRAVQERVNRQAKEVSSRLTEAIGGVELDLRKLRDNAQEFAMQQVGRAAEYAVKAGEAYNGLADRGRGAVRTWRGDAADGVQDLAVTIEPEPAPAAPAQRNGAARKPSQGRKAGK